MEEISLAEQRRQARKKRHIQKRRGRLDLRTNKTGKRK